ncbi:MAG: hypothetical protein GY757_39175 [bacterium]|nr:hypothetical protein [bacterium]
MSKTNEEKLEIYRDVLGTAWGFVDYHDWPVKLNSVFHLFLTQFGEEFMEDLDYLENEKKLSIEEIGKLFYNPARIFRMIEYTIYSLRKKRLPLDEQRKVALKLMAMAKSLKYGSEFNEDGRNTIYDPAKVEDIQKNILQKKNSTIEESRLIHRFCGVAWAYTESIFFRAHDVTKEIHGPYTYKDRNMMVKEYMNLNPHEIWPDVEMLPCNNIKIYKSYNEKVQVQIDALNHLALDAGAQPVPNLMNHYVEIDGKEASPDQLKDLLKIIGATIADISGRVEKMTWHERVSKYAEIFWFRKRPVRDARGIDWKVPQKVLDNIAAGKPLPRRETKLSEEQVRRLAKLTI